MRSTRIIENKKDNQEHDPRLVVHPPAKCRGTNNDDDVEEISLSNILQTVVLAPSSSRTTKKKTNSNPPPPPRRRCRQRYRHRDDQTWCPAGPCGDNGKREERCCPSNNNNKKKNNSKEIDDQNYHHVETSPSSPAPPPPPPPPPLLLAPAASSPVLPVPQSSAMWSSSRTPTHLMQQLSPGSTTTNVSTSLMFSSSSPSKLKKCTLAEVLLVSTTMESNHTTREMLKKCEECLRQCRIHQVFEKLDINRRIQKQYRKSINVAKQFHTFVVLSQYFETWRAETERRRALIGFYRNTLRKILLKWRFYAEEQMNRRRSCMIVSMTLTNIQFRKLWLTIRILSAQCWRYRFLAKAFREWKSIVLKHTVWRINMFLRFEDNQRRIILHQWNDIVQRRMWCRWRNYQILKKVVKAWKMITEESIVMWELQLQKSGSYYEEKMFHLMGRIFEHMRIQTRRKNCMRKAYAMVKKRHKDCQMKIILKDWKEHYEFQRQKHRTLSRIITRRMIIGWRDYVEKKQRRQTMQVKIIINLWRLFTENKINRRRLLMKAKQHWSSRLCRGVLQNWRIVTSREYGRIRSPYPTIPRSGHRRNSYSIMGGSDCLINNPASKHDVSRNMWRHYNATYDIEDYYNQSSAEKEGHLCRTSFKRELCFGTTNRVDSYLKNRRMKERLMAMKSSRSTAVSSVTGSCRRKYDCGTSKPLFDTSSKYYSSVSSAKQEPIQYTPSYAGLGESKTSTGGAVQSSHILTGSSNEFQSCAGILEDVLGNDQGHRPLSSPWYTSNSSNIRDIPTTTTEPFGAPRMPKWVAQALSERTRKTNHASSTSSFSESNFAETGSVCPSQPHHSSSSILVPPSCYAEEKHHHGSNQRRFFFEQQATKDMSTKEAFFFHKSVCGDTKLQERNNFCNKKLWEEDKNHLLKPFSL